MLKILWVHLEYFCKAWQALIDQNEQHDYVTGFWKITLMGILLIQRKSCFNNLKLCHSPALAATNVDFSAEMEKFTTFKSS